MAVYYQVYNSLIKGNYTEVYLDITHGINYMPHLASEAVRLAAYVYAVRNRKSVSLVTVNSDPYSLSRSQSPGNKQQVDEASREVPDLTIHRTYDEKVIRWNAPNVVGTLALGALEWYARVNISYKDLYDNEKWQGMPISIRAETLLLSRLTQDERDALKLGLVVSASLRDFLYPVLLSFKDEIEKYRDGVNSELERLVKSFVKIEREGGRVFVKYMYRPSILMAERALRIEP